jgi:ubiquinone/menaquinone biosynthesis C-methylase UbiE
MIQRFSENGREYYRFRNDMYLFPCDDVGRISAAKWVVWIFKSNVIYQTEAERLDIMHTLIYTTALKSRLHLAKLSDPRRVLDIGFGTGFWMMEMAKKYPRAEVIGYDLILPDGKLPKVGPTLHWQAPVDYLAPRWPVEDGSVDIVHMAQLCGSVNDWASLYRKAYR